MFFTTLVLSLILLFTQCLAIPRPGVPVQVFSNTTSSSTTGSSSGNAQSAEEVPSGLAPAENTGIATVVDSSTLSVPGASTAANGASSTGVTIPAPPGGPVIPAVTSPPYPLGTGVSGAGVSTVNIGTGSASLLVTQNSTCGSCTVNVENADLYFWNSVTYNYPPSIYKSVGVFNSTISFSQVPNPSPFSFNPSGLGANHVETVFFTPPTVKQTFTDLTDIVGPPTTQTIAGVVTASPPSQVVAPGFTAVYPTPYIYMADFEYCGNGNSAASNSNGQPYAAPAVGQDEGWYNKDTVTGQLDQSILPDSVLASVGLTNCARGTFQGTPTLRIGVKLASSTTRGLGFSVLETETQLILPTAGHLTVTNSPNPQALTESGPTIPGLSVPTQPANTQAVPSPPSSPPPSPSPIPPVIPPSSAVPAPETASSVPVAVSIIQGITSTNSPPSSQPAPVASLPASAPAPSETISITQAQSQSPTAASGQSQTIMIQPAPAPQTQPPAQPVAPPQTVSTVIIGSQTVSAQGSSPIVIGPSSSTLLPGGPAVTVSNSIISLPPAGSSFVVAPIPQNTAPVSVQPGVALTPVAGSSVFSIAGTTIAPGGPGITVGGTSISLAPSATAVIIGGSTSPLPSALPPSSAITIIPPVTLPAVGGPGGATLSENVGSTFVIGSQTLIPGGPAITVGGTPISLAPAATAVVVDGTSTIPLPRPQPTTVSSPVTITPTIPGAAPVTLTPANSGSVSAYLIGTQPLVPGGPPVTLSNGETVSLASDASAVVVGTINAITTASVPIITVSRSNGLSPLTFTEDMSNSDFVIGSQTLLPGGPAISIPGGPMLSLKPGATEVVVGNSTIVLPTTFRNNTATATSASAIASSSSTETPTQTIKPNPSPSPTDNAARRAFVPSGGVISAALGMIGAICVAL